MMSIRSKFFLSMAFYGIFSVLLFFTHYFGFNVDQRFEFWSLFFISLFIACSYGYLIFAIEKYELTRNVKIFGALTALFLFALYFCMPYPKYVINDLYLYFFHAKIFVIHHANPYIALPRDFIDHVGIRFMSNWLNQNYNYGPLWLVISSIPLLISTNIFWGVFAFKILSLIFYLGSLCAIYVLFDKNWKKLFLFAVNPVILYFGINGSHNDMALLLFLVLSILALKNERYAWSFILLAFAVLIKFAIIMLFPIFIIFAYRKQKIQTLLSLVLVAGIFFFSYLPFTMDINIIMGNSTLHNAKLSGPLFSIFYLMAQKSFIYNMEIFSNLKNIFLILFIASYFIILFFYVKKDQSFESAMKFCAIILLCFYILTYWFQPWYILWIIPLILYYKTMPIIFLSIGLVFYSFIFYIISYTFSSFIGFLVTLVAIIFVLAFFLMRKLLKLQT